MSAVEPATGPAKRARARLERRKAATRQRIVDAASQLFWTQGYEATSIHDVAEAADVAVGTLYLHFSGKADVALVQFQQWMTDLVATLEARPERETPDQMLAATLRALSDQGYTSGQRLRDEAGRPVPSVVMGILFTEDSQAIAGRVYQIMIETEQALSALFARRLSYPPGAIEAQIIASAFVAAWRWPSTASPTWSPPASIRRRRTRSGCSASVPTPTGWRSSGRSRRIDDSQNPQRCGPSLSTTTRCGGSSGRRLTTAFPLNRLCDTPDIASGS